jgi:PAS domain S-box-containing protein
MPWIEALSDPQQLRRCIRDLVALSTLPAIWRAYDAQQIADSIAAALLSMLDADVVYVALPRGQDGRIIEVAHIGKNLDDRSALHVRGLMRARLADAAPEEIVEIPHPLGAGTIRLATAPIGFSANSILAVGSVRPDFPTEVQRLLLGIAANEATIALQRWQAETDESRFMALIDRSSEFIGVASLDGRPQYINPAGLKLIGLTNMKEAARRHILDFVSPDERMRVATELWPVVLKSGRWTGELNFCHVGTGTTIPFLVDWFRIDNPRTENPMNIATVSRDLTAQKRSEQALRSLNSSLEQRVVERTAQLADANEKLMAEITERERADARLQELQLELFHTSRLSAAGQMAAALAHELNQPLTATANSISAARRLFAKNGRTHAETITGMMNEAAGQALRAGQIIQRLRNFVSRGETERTLESVATMIEEASALAFTGSGAIGVDLRYRFDPNVSRAFVDRVQIQQVLVNLMRNALDAMAGCVRRELEVSTALIDPRRVRISVADTGSGLSEDVVAHLFEAFYSTKHDGMGLGLSICRSIVEAHGGELVCENGPKGGTTFHFTVAADPSDGARGDH